MSRQHPVFVYGTLRPGQNNYQRLLAGRTTRERPAVAKGLALYGTGFPYAVQQSGTRVLGDLISIEPAAYQDVLTDLDQLEGYHPTRAEASHYVRILRTVITSNSLPGGGTWDSFHTAWIYLAARRIHANTMPRITDDDWLAHTATR